MIYRLLAAALIIVSSEAIELNPASMSRRAAVASLASLGGLPVASLAKAPDLPYDPELYAGYSRQNYDVYARANDGNLDVTRAIERAKSGDLVVGASATCEELERLVTIDQEALQFEENKVKGLKEGLKSSSSQSVKDFKEAELARVEAAEAKLQSQVGKLKALRQEKDCTSAAGSLKKRTDLVVYQRADKGKLDTLRVIERTKAGELVDGTGASCPELRSIIAVDKKAIQYEIDKLEGLAAKAKESGSINYNQRTLVQSRMNVIMEQTEKLEALSKTRGCE